MLDREGVRRLAERFLAQVKGVQGLVVTCATEEDCRAMEAALVGIGQTAAEILGGLPAAYDLFLQDFVLADFIHAADVLSALSSLAKEVQSIVESVPSPAKEGEVS
jgi:uncharacterized protein Usg